MRFLPLLVFEAFRPPQLMVLLISPLRALGYHFGNIYIGTASSPRLEESEVIINSILGPPEKGCPMPLVSTCQPRGLSLVLAIPRLTIQQYCTSYIQSRPKKPIVHQKPSAIVGYWVARDLQGMSHGVGGFFFLKKKTAA